MPCENQEGCDFYQKMLPLFEKHLGGLNEREKSMVELYRSDICETGLDNGRVCTLYEIKACGQYPNCTTMIGRLTKDFDKLIVSTSISACLLERAGCILKVNEMSLEEAANKTIKYIQEGLK